MRSHTYYAIFHTSIFCWVQRNYEKVESQNVFFTMKQLNIYGLKKYLIKHFFLNLFYEQSNDGQFIPIHEGWFSSYKKRKLGKGWECNWIENIIIIQQVVIIDSSAINHIIILFRVCINHNCDQYHILCINGYIFVHKHPTLVIFTTRDVFSKF